jgi:hypothetical protein
MKNIPRTDCAEVGKDIGKDNRSKFRGRQRARLAKSMEGLAKRFVTKFRYNIRILVGTRVPTKYMCYAPKPDPVQWVNCLIIQPRKT